MPVHDSTIGFDRSADNFIVVLKVDYVDIGLGVGVIAGLLPYTDIVVGLKCLEGFSRLLGYPQLSGLRKY